MKCPKCSATMQKKYWHGQGYWECRCGYSLAKPEEEMKEEKEHETDTDQQDGMD